MIVCGVTGHPLSRAELVARGVDIRSLDPEDVPPPATEDEGICDLLRKQIGLLTAIRDQLDIMLYPERYGR